MSQMFFNEIEAVRIAQNMEKNGLAFYQRAAADCASACAASGESVILPALAERMAFPNSMAVTFFCKYPIAPACNAPCTMFCSAKLVSAMTLTFGYF